LGYVLLRVETMLMGKAETVARWRRLVREQAESGLSGAGFCRERALCRKSFYSWRKRLQAETESKPVSDRGFAEVVHRAGNGTWSGVSIHLGPPRTICVERGFDVETLRAALSAVDALTFA